MWSCVTVCIGTSFLFTIPGEKKKGTDEETFTVIVATQSAAQLHAIMAEYENLSKKTLLDAVKSETSGDYRQALLAVCEWCGGGKYH